MPLTGWLSRWPDGYFCVSGLKPRRAKVMGTDQESFYFREGDPVGHRYMCAPSTIIAADGDERVKNMQPMDEPILVDIAIKVREKREVKS